MTDEVFDDEADPEIPNIGYWIGLYAIPGLDFHKLMRELENCPIPIPLSQCIVRSEGRVSLNKLEAPREAARLHPMRCARNTALYRAMFLVVDSRQYQKDGILLVHIDWDKQIEGQSMQQLARKGTEAVMQTRRLAVASHTTTTLINMIVQRYVPFKSKQPTFLFYDESKYYTDSVLFLDSRHHRCLSGMERFLEGSFTTEAIARKDLDKDKSSLEKVAMRHPLHVYRERFCCTLERGYFVYCEKGISSREQLVTLVRTEWDGNAEILSEKVLTAQDDVERAADLMVMDCPAGQAYDMLVQVARGAMPWTGKPFSV